MNAASGMRARTRRRTRTGRRAALLAIAICCALAYGSPVGATVGSPLQWQSGSERRPAPHLSTAADIEVSGLVARVRLTQRFRNDGDAWVEGIYTFPLPDGAAVDALAMSYGDTRVVGEIREKEEAEKLYGAARDAGRRTVLVDRQRPNLFTTRIANVGPGETVEIEIAWQQTVAYDAGEYALHLPLTLTPRYVPGQRPGTAGGTDQVPDAEAVRLPFTESPNGHRLTLTGVIDAGVELAMVTGRYHPLQVTPDDGAYRIAFAGPDVPMDRDLEIAWRPLAGTVPDASLFRGTGEDRTLLLFFRPPHDEEGPGVWRPARELVFVIDTSGSMHGESLAQAKRALALALRRLQPRDRFNVIEFNSRTRRVFSGSVPATRPRVLEALRLVAALEAEGGTEMEAALSAALAPSASGLLRQVVFITDGSVGNEPELLELIRARLGDTRLFTVAIGSAPNRWFMRKAAQAGRGASLVIGAETEVGERMARLFRQLERPALTNITVEWPAGVEADTYPHPIPDLYHGEPLMVSARLDGPLPRDGIVSVSGRRGDGYWIRQLVFGEARPYAGVGKLWARGRIEALDDARRAGGDPEEIRGRIMETALTHHLVSRHTSLVAVDVSSARTGSEALDSRRVPGLLPHGQREAAIFGLPATGTGAPLRRLIGLGCLLAGLALLVGLRVQDLRYSDAA